VALGGDFGKDVEQGLVGTDDKGGALDAEDFFAVHVLFLEYAKLIADFLVYICKERVGQVVFGAEFGLGLGRVAGDAEDDGAGGLELEESVAKAACFNGAAGSIGPRIKEEYDGLAGVVREADGLVFVGLQGKISYFYVKFHGENPRMSDGLTINLHYSRAGRSVSLWATVTLMGLAGVAWAQYPGQVTKKSKDAAELRAIAVLEWTGDAGKPKACRLVPVTVYDGEKLQDGGIFMARPEPMSLAGEVEYELKQNGKTFGLFDIKNAGQEQGSWVGYGDWKAPPKPKNTAAAPVLDKEEDWNDDKPVLHRKKHADDTTGSGPGSSRSSTPAAPSDPDRPTLHKSPSSGSGGDTSAGTASDPDRPTLHKATPQADSGSDSNGGSSQASDPDRPTMKRSKKPPEDVGHAEVLADVTDPDRPRLKRGKSSGNGLEIVPSLMGLPPDMQQAVAVSDAKNQPDHPWSYAWANPDDEEKMKAAMEDLAREALGISAPAAKPATTTKRTATTARKTAKPAAPPPPPVELEDEHFRVFELTYGSGATMVLTARTGDKPAEQKYVTLIAQPDLYGNVRVVFKSVADGAHLDETPRMRLVDAVDALADNRGELLFELRGDGSRQFALYRIWRGTAEKLFVSGGGVYGTVSDN